MATGQRGCRLSPRGGALTRYRPNRATLTSLPKLQVVAPTTKLPTVMILLEPVTVFNKTFILRSYVQQDNKRLYKKNKVIQEQVGLL